MVVPFVAQEVYSDLPTMNGYEGLAAKTIILACVDIERSYNAILNGDVRLANFKTFDECVAFLKSDWADFLCATGHDSLMKYLRRFNMRWVERQRKKCV